MRAVVQGAATFSLTRRLAVTSRKNFCTAMEEVIPNSKHKKVFFTMPDIMDAKEGKVKKWLKAEGEAFSIGDSICEVSCGGIALALESESPGIMVERLANEGQFIEVNKPIAAYVRDKSAYMTYLENKHIQAEEKQMLAEAQELKQEQVSAQKPTPLVLMREIKHLIQEGHLEDGSEFATKLQALARHGDEDLMEVFQASYDGATFNRDSFDGKFFLTNARGVVAEK